MLLRVRKSIQINNENSNLGTIHSKRNSQDKETSYQKSKQKSKDKISKNCLFKRLSFQSPSGKDDSNSGRKFSLLNYMIFKEKTLKLPANVDKKKLPLRLTKDSFQILQVLGKGGFGRVMKVKLKRTRKLYAMKEMSKKVVITKQSVRSILNERELLSQLNHPFLVNMAYAFQDRDNLYLVMDLMPGGDLRYHIGNYGSFPQKIVKFFVCCVILGLEYLHQNYIIHRDIKPQNLVIDQKGYLRLTDLGIAKICEPNNHKNTSGTPGYMAPQVMNRQNHSFCADFYAVGVIAYECMLGRVLNFLLQRPYKGYSRQEIKQQIMLFEANIKKHQIPPGWDEQSADFINRLLKRKQEERLGFKGIYQIKSHPWFKDVDWMALSHKKINSPFVPSLDQRNYDTVSVSQYNQEYLERLQENGLLLKDKTVQEIFQGYQYQQVNFV